MIFYSLLSHYQDSDKANLVLTAMIVYIIIYIALPEEWNGYALAAITIIDYMSLRLPPFDFIFNYISQLKVSTVKSVNALWVSWVNWLWPGAARRQTGGRKHKSKSASTSKGKGKAKVKVNRKREKKGKHKKVRFSAKNQYHEYNPFGGQPPAIGGAGVVGFGSGGAGAGLNIPDWILTPQQRLMRAQQTERANQLKQLQKPGFLIDNRHLTIDDSESSDESIASDESSELSNWEEGID